MASVLTEGRILLLDSAQGSELERRGLRLDPPLWSARALIEAPEAILEIHSENVDAGADILTANTFRTAPFTIDQTELEGRACELSSRAVELAREAARGSVRQIVVAGSVAPLADCYRPDLVPADEVLRGAHAAHVSNLVSAGVDILLVETMNTIREARIAAEAAFDSGLPFAVSFVTNGEGLLLSGERLENAAAALSELRPGVIGVNCIDSRMAAGEVRRLVRVSCGTPVAVYANTLSSGDSPEIYSERAREWLDAGASIVGGCCGTTPEYTRALRTFI